MAVRPGAARSQTLARRGWAGSGLNAAPWWQDAVFYELPPAVFLSDKSGDTAEADSLPGRLAALRSLGADALVLSPFALKPGDSAQAGTAESAREESFDRLLAEAGRRHLRVLVDLPLDAPATTAALARFWLGRGVAGFRLTLNAPVASAAAAGAIVHEVGDLRTLCSSYSGDRVLLWDGPVSFASLLKSANQSDPESGDAQTRNGTRLRQAAAAHGRTAQTAGPQLEVRDAIEQLPPTVSASALRSALVDAQSPDGQRPSLPVLALRIPDDASGADPAGASARAVTRTLAAALLTAPSPPLFVVDRAFVLGLVKDTVPPVLETNGPVVSEAVQPDPPAAESTLEPNSLPDFLQLLSSLRHQNAALRSGGFELLAMAQPDVVAWVRSVRGGGPGHAPPLIVLASLSAQPHVVALDNELLASGIRVPAGSPIRELAVLPASSAHAPTPSTTQAVLEPYGLLIGELHGTAGLPHTAPKHHRRTRRRRSRR